MTAPTRRGLLALIVGAFAAPALAKVAPPKSAWFLKPPPGRPMIMTCRTYVVPNDWIVTREVLEENLYAEVKEKVKPWLRMN